MSKPTEVSAQRFSVVRRGYDPEQVDAHLRTLTVALTDYQRAHRGEHGRAERAEAELRRLRAEPSEAREPAGEDAPGFGFRVEKLMRAAEQEASDVRAAAAHEARALLEAAGKDVERHRHQVEQALIARNVAMEHEAARRRIELNERERGLAEQAALLREEYDRVLAEGTRRAEDLVREAGSRAEAARREADRDIRDRGAAWAAELDRLRGLRDEVRGQLGRMLDSLVAEFDGPRPAPGAAAGTDAGNAPLVSVG